MRILLTGAAGSLGRVLTLGLCDLGHEVVGLDLVPEPEGFTGNWHTADCSDREAVRAVFDEERLDAVVHMAGRPDEADLPTELTSHVITTAALLDAMVEHRVTRIVYASSNHAVGRTPRRELVSDDALPRPDSFYGVAKVAAEALLQLYVDRYSIDAISCRIGSFLPEPTTARNLATWLSPDDAVRMVEASLTAPAPGYAVLYGISDNTDAWWDLEPGRRLGYERRTTRPPTATASRRARRTSSRRPSSAGPLPGWRSSARRSTCADVVSDPRGTFLDLLYTGAARADFDRLVEEHPDRADEYDIALRLRDLIARHRAREAELSALYETAHDLTAMRDLDEILTAVVRRARQLLGADMTYLSLNDEVEGASYMKVTDGALTHEFKTLRLPLGTGLLGLVAQTGAPYFTEDYQADERFVHRHYIDDAVAGERIRAILGVPLLVEGRVIGALLAVHRTVRRFPADEVSLLMSFAAHASVALENARLFARLDEANRTISAHASSVEAAALAHERMTDLLLAGGGVAEVVDVLAQVLGGDVAAWRPERAAASPAPMPRTRRTRHRGRARESARSGHAIRAGRRRGRGSPSRPAEHLATVVLDGRRRARGGPSSARSSAVRW